MTQEQHFVIESEPVLGAKSPKIHGVAQWPETPACGPDCWPTVIICHGFKGFMEWGFFPPLAELLVERGFTVIRFNYSGSGMRPGDELVTDLEAFRSNTFSLELIETLRVLQAAGTEIAPDHVDPERIALLGHSRGGGASLLAAAHPDWRNRLRALVTWAGVGTFDRFDAAAKKAWHAKGALPIQNARTGQDLELGIELLADLENQSAVLDLPAAAVLRRAPWLIVHGGGDETVPPTEAEALNRAAVGPKELLIVDGASHTFGAQHPFAGPTRELIKVMNASQTWLRRHLCGG
ncbi:MAG: alpha/beta fold hydrolase [bacterium]|nr:alpha/beta fold hydrolase [bacterium]